MPSRWGSDTTLRYIEEAELGIKLARGIGGTAVAQEEREKNEPTCQQEEKTEPSSEMEKKEETTGEERESGTPMRAEACVTYAAVFREKKTIRGWKYRRDTSLSILDDNDDVRREKCCE